MKQQHVVESPRDRLRSWRDVERAALEAENELQHAGVGPHDAHILSLSFRAKSLRHEANRMFASILRSVRLEGEPSDHLQLGPDQGRDEHTN